jgi:hypothetical protein
MPNRAETPQAPKAVPRAGVRRAGSVPLLIDALFFSHRIRGDPRVFSLWFWLSSVVKLMKLSCSVKKLVKVSSLKQVLTTSPVSAASDSDARLMRRPRTHSKRIYNVS